MMNKLLLALMLITTAANAENEFSYASNSAGGFMFFTFTPCIYVNTGARVPNQYYMYSTGTNAVKITDGCYLYKDPFYFITWNGGGTTQINVNAVTPIKQ